MLLTITFDRKPETKGIIVVITIVVHFVAEVVEREGEIGCKKVACLSWVLVVAKKRNSKFMCLQSRTLVSAHTQLFKPKINQT